MGGSSILSTIMNGATAVKRTFTVSITQEDEWYVARSLDVEVASQGKTEEEALLNLREALELYFSSPAAGDVPVLRHVEVEIGAA
jgi:predicted RNase H-like HicB family nuclease